MEYRAFALKWRPQTFDEVVAQEHITTILKNAIKQNRIAHAYLFAGPRGTGKTSTARILAKALNCKQGPRPTPCNKCQNCLEIRKSNNLDVLEIDGASNRGIDEIRNLRMNVKLSPSHSRYKIYIIDEVHMLTEEASNALLKTLEEPPEHVKFIFATTRPQKILPTILSRCQRFNFRRIPTKDIVEKLKEIVEKEKIKIEEDAIYLIAKSTDGSLRDAESVLDQFTSYSDKKITQEDVNTVIGSVGQEFIFNITQKIIDKDTKGVLVLINDVVNKGKDLSIFILELIEHIRNIMIVKETDNFKDLIDTSADSIERTRCQAEHFSKEDLLYIFSLFSKVQYELEYHPISRIPIEMALVRLTREGGIVNVNNLMQKLENIVKETKINELNTAIDKKRNPEGANPSKNNNPTIKTENDCVNSDDIESNNLNQEEFEPIWQKACQKIKEIKTPVGLYIAEGKPVKLKDNLLTIGFYPGFSFHRENLEGKKNKKLVEETFSSLLNEKIKVDFIDFSERPKENQPKENPKTKQMKSTDGSQNQPKDKINPIIDSALKIFDGLMLKKEDREKA